MHDLAKYAIGTILGAAIYAQVRGDVNWFVIAAQAFEELSKLT